MLILVIEDDAAAAGMLVEGLKANGHAAEHVTDIDEAYERVRRGWYDALIVDRMLPGGHDGLELIDRLRVEGFDLPIMVLSALVDVDERVRGLRRGGDDYLTKPYELVELVARLEALTRRNQETPVRLRVCDLELDLIAHEVTRAGEPVRLQPREFRLLEFLARHAGQVVTRSMLLENVWACGFDPQTNVIDVHISRLRSKIDRGAAQPLIHTLRGRGYMLGDAP
ncbi:response regulator transcription factor [Plasticicumulans acidivorans]|uniref:Winged helix family two component transcriptional regulator n=1 Tax=Plasticicumulans acidivorans TaxID=886464 RepID=A0A317MVJ4_9GAMM|nr:response regulator transcription factor [Plasticicumulans acidivorans]PWV62301.1 winged helix family two component transcriptional regulator [Plasticicumulans acidivorans]